MLSIRLSGDALRMNAIGLEVLEESGLIRDRDGWWRLQVHGTEILADRSGI